MRRIQARSLLNRSKVHDYCVNPYTGCEINCVYCYARLFMQRYFEHKEPWGSFVDIKTNAPDLLRRQLPRAKRGTVWISSVCDPYQPMEKATHLTRRCLTELARWQFPVHIQTKSALACRDLDVFQTFKDIEIGFTITTDEERVARVFEPKASTVADRISALGKIHAAGIPTFAFIGPLLPLDPSHLAGLLAGKVDRVLIDRMNYVHTVRHFYKRHGLQDALTDRFFRESAERLKEEFLKSGIPVRILF